jgi:Zn-dependent protease with chaperone function
MNRYLFVARVFALLIGFYLLCAGLIAGLIALTVVAINTVGMNRGTGLLLLVTLAAVFVVLRGVFVSTRVRARDIVGVAVTPDEQPALWARIRELARRVGTRAPRRLYIVAETNAAVWENTRLLGLLPGRRHMMIGVPLLVALTPGQLDSVLAHELGHYGNKDTRLGGLVGRTRHSVLGALTAAGRPRKVALPGSDLFVVLFRWYAKVVLRATQQASRAQEYAADRVAAEIAGPANTIAALSEMRGIGAAFDFYLSRYIAPGLQLGLTPPPPDVFGGFAGLLAEPSRQAELDEMRQNPGKQQADPYDSHPPTADRIAALAALPQPVVPPDPPGLRAVAILANPAHVLDRVATRALQKQIGGKQVATWDTLAQATGQHRADEHAKPLADVVTRLTGQPATLGSFLQLVETGRYTQILDALPRNEASRKTGATGRIAREHAKTELAQMLSGWLIGHAARSGRVMWAHSWADVAGDLRMAPELKTDLEAAVDDLVAVRPNAARLRAVLQRLAVTA